MKARTLTILSVSVALQVVLLLGALILPTVKISVLFAASIINGILCAAGYKKIYVLISYAAAGILSMILISNYIIPVSFIMFFGLYGIIHFTTKSKSLIIKELLRFAFLFVGISSIYFIFKSILVNSILFDVPYLYYMPAIIIIGYVFFQIVYDKVIQEFFRNKYLSNLISNSN